MDANRLYLDEPGRGPSRETSHPVFVETCADDLYYDPADEYAPFGNDEGAEALSEVQEWYRREGGDADVAAHVIADWEGFLGVPARDVVTVLRIGDITRFSLATGRDAPPSTQEYDVADDQAMLATALAQLKITGSMQPQMRMAALAAIDRMSEVARSFPEPRWSDVLDQMRDDLVD